MSKLEVREIGPISGETEVRLAEGATAVGFGGGKILQVVQGIYSTQLTTTSTSFISSELKASITPSSTSSKILVIAKISGSQVAPSSSGNPAGSLMSLYRDGSSIVSDGAEHYSGAYSSTTDAAINFLDSPLSTSSLNYEIYFKLRAGGSVTCHDNNRQSTIILMEVSG